MSGADAVDYKFLPGGPSNETKAEEALKEEVTINLTWIKL